MKKVLVTVVSILLSFAVYSQSSISGTVTDSENGSRLYSSIKVPNTIIGVNTDFDGNYTLKLDPGTYTIECSSMGFVLSSKEVTIAAGENKTINFQLSTTAVEISKAVVYGTVDKRSNGYLEALKKKEVSLMEVMSSKDAAKTGESTVGGVMKRVTGVSTVGGQIYVRGLSDRYIKTTLNGAEIPSMDARKNSVDLNIFPTRSLDNIQVVKSAKASLPGDFSGAYINMVTKNSPDTFNLSYSLTANYNTNTTFQEVLTSQGGATDWLAFDDGTRGIPDALSGGVVPQLNVGSYYDALVSAGYEDELAAIGVNGQSDIGISGNQTSIYNIINSIDGLNTIDDVNAHLQDYREVANAELSEIGKSFSNSWDNETRVAPIDLSHSLTFGNTTQLFKRTLGYNVGFIYRKSTRQYENGTTGRYKLTGDESEATSLNTELLLKDRNTSENTMWNALFNLSYTLNENNSIGFIFMPTMSAQNQSRYQVGLNLSDESGLYQEQRSQVYNEKSMNYFQLMGKHNLNFKKGAELTWNGTMVRGQFDSPDFKVLFNSYQIADNGDISYDIFDNLYPSPTRFFRTLSDENYDMKVNLKIPIADIDSKLERNVSFGYSYVTRERSYFENRYSFVNNNLGYDGNTSEYFSEENLNVAPGSDDGFIYVRDDSEQQNNYTASQLVQGAYAMTDYRVNENFFVNGGLRVEHTNMNLESNIIEENNLVGLQADEFRGTINDLDLLPSVNLTYKLKENFETGKLINIRAAAYRTVARPVFREKAPYSAFDFDQQEVLTGNVDLVNTNISNYDLRLDYYPRRGEILSASVFLKDFTNPIEQVIIATAANVEITWENAEKASIYGIELEARKNLDFISDKMSNFSVGTNLTLVKSRTQIAASELEQIRATDPDHEETRPMFGQSPYIFNAILSYSNDSIGFTANLSYNIQGERLILVTKGGTPDIYDLPRNLVNLTIGKRLNDHFSMSFRAMNILDAKIQNVYRFQEQTYDRQSFQVGRNFSLGITYTI